MPRSRATRYRPRFSSGLDSLGPQIREHRPTSHRVHRHGLIRHPKRLIRPSIAPPAVSFLTAIPRPPPIQMAAHSTHPSSPAPHVNKDLQKRIPSAPYLFDSRAFAVSQRREAIWIIE